MSLSLSRPHNGLAHRTPNQNGSHIHVLVNWCSMSMCPLLHHHPESPYAMCIFQLALLSALLLLLSFMAMFSSRCACCVQRKYIDFMPFIRIRISYTDTHNIMHHLFCETLQIYSKVLLQRNSGNSDGRLKGCRRGREIVERRRNHQTTH